MNRAALLALAAAMTWSTGMAAAQTGAGTEHSPARAAHSATFSTQQGTAPADKNKAKQRAARKLTGADKSAAKHAYRSSRADRSKLKQGNSQTATASAGQTLAQHSYRTARSDRFRVKQGNSNVHVAGASKTVAKHAARSSRSERVKIKQARSDGVTAHGGKTASKQAYVASRTDRQKVRQGAHEIQPLARSTKAGPKHRTRQAALAQHKLKHSVKIKHVKAKKNSTIRKQNVRRLSSGKA
jgi:hypothetical protein